MKSGAEFESWIKELVRGEVGRVLGIELAEMPEDDRELRDLVQQRAASLRARRAR